MDFDGNGLYAKYSSFSVGTDTEYCQMTVSGYSGTAGDSLGHDNGGRFYVEGQGEPRYEKTGFLHMRKQRRRSAAQCNCAADQRLCFRYTDSNIPLLPKSEISSH